MRISGSGRETFLYLNGIQVSRPIRLGNNAELLPAQCSPNPKDIISTAKSETDIGVIALFLRSVSSQIHLRASSSKQLAIDAWNTVWDAILVGAFCNCEVVCNLQSNVAAEKFNSDSKLEVTNYHFRGFSSGKPYIMTESEAIWIENHIGRARALLDLPAYQNAIHCLATYRWHTVPRVRLAILWAGIEGLFGIESEIVFRLSLYTARFLEPESGEKCSEVFASVKRLYKYRSAAVHGSKTKGNLEEAVDKSALLLLRLLKRCVTGNGLPKTELLAP